LRFKRILLTKKKIDNVILLLQNLFKIIDFAN